VCRLGIQLPVYVQDTTDFSASSADSSVSTLPVSGNPNTARESGGHAGSDRLKTAGEDGADDAAEEHPETSTSRAIPAIEARIGAACHEGPPLIDGLPDAQPQLTTMSRVITRLPPARCRPTTLERRRGVGGAAVQANLLRAYRCVNPRARRLSCLRPNASRSAE
jgi:hypothetical protein